VTISGSKGRPLAASPVPGGWIDNGTPQTAPVARVAPGQRVRVCVTNRGARWAFVFGDLGVPPEGEAFPSGPRPTITPANATVDGVGIGGDISMSFVSDRPRSLLSRIPEMFQRASAFRPGFVGPWTYWVLLVAMLIGAPLALGRALFVSLRGARDPEPPAGTGGNGRHPTGAATVEPRPQPEDTAASTRGSRD
jgi:hypothetical protein